MDGARALPMRPSTMKSTSPPNSRSTASALRSIRRPARFALVETMAVRASRHSWAASRWAVTRTASVVCAPRNRRTVEYGRPVAAGSSQVCRPGHESEDLLAAARAGEVNVRQQAAVTVGDHDQTFGPRAAFDAQDAAHRRGVARVAAEAEARFGGIRHHAPRADDPGGAGK